MMPIESSCFTGVLRDIISDYLFLDLDMLGMFDIQELGNDGS